MKRILIVLTGVFALGVSTYFVIAGQRPATVEANLANSVAGSVKAVVPSSKEASNFEKGQSAFANGQLFSPAGENALEYFLSEFDSSERSRNAAMELVPMATDAMLTDLNAGNLDEAERLLQLIEKADPRSSYITVMRTRLTALRKNVAAEPELVAPATIPVEATRTLATLERPSAAPAEAIAPALAPKTDSLAERTEASVDTRTASLVRAPSAPVSTPSLEKLAQEAAPPELDAQSNSPLVSNAKTQSETPARLISKIQAKFPQRARQQGLTGWVDLRLTVAANGSVKKAEVLNGTPARVFDTEAIRAAQRLKYEPKRVGNLAVETSVNQRIVFGGG